MRRHWPLLCILAIALLVRIAAAYYWDHRVGGGFYFGDSEGYWTLAQTIAEGEPYEVFERRAFRTPGYPAILAPLFVVGGSDAPIMWARLQNALLGTLTVAAVWLLANTLFDRRAAILAAIAVALSPNAVIHSVLVLTETPFTLLMVLSLYYWGRAWQREDRHRRLREMFIVGLLTGIATLVRPSWWLFPAMAIPMACVLGCFAGEPRRWAGVLRHIESGACLAVGFVLVMTPWWLYTHRATGHFVPTSTNVGASLYDGLNPMATGASDMYFVDAEPFEPSRYAEIPIGPREVQVDADMKEAAVDWAKENPGKVAGLAFTKALRMWSPVPNEASLRAPPVMAALAICYIPVALLAVIGVFRTFQRGFAYWLCWLPAVYFTMLHVVFVSSIRYRMPAMVMLAALAAGAVFELYDCYARKRQKERVTA